MSFYNNCNKWNLRSESIKKETHEEPPLNRGIWHPWGRGKQESVQLWKPIPCKALKLPHFHQMRQIPCREKHLIKTIIIMHKTSELRSDSCYNDNLGGYMTNFMFIYNALVLGNFDIVSENKITEPCSFSAKNICIFPSLNAPLGS